MPSYILAYVKLDDSLTEKNILEKGLTLSKHNFIDSFRSLDKAYDESYVTGNKSKHTLVIIECANTKEPKPGNDITLKAKDIVRVTNLKNEKIYIKDGGTVIMEAVDSFCRQDLKNNKTDKSNSKGNISDSDKTGPGDEAYLKAFGKHKKNPKFEEIETSSDDEDNLRTYDDSDNERSDDSDEEPPTKLKQKFFQPKPAEKKVKFPKNEARNAVTGSNYYPKSNKHR